jgi:hypothetical protein
MNSQTLTSLLFNPEVSRIVRHALTVTAGALGYAVAADNALISQAADGFIAIASFIIALILSRVSDGKSAVPKPAVAPLMFLGFFSLFTVALGGCGTVGATVTSGRDQGKIVGVAPPVIVDIQDDDKRGLVTATGPSGWVSRDELGTQAFFANSPPQAITFRDGSRQVDLSGAANLSGKGLTFGSDGSITIAEFTTEQDKTITASNQGVAATSNERLALTESQRDVLIAQVQASTEIAESMKPILITLIESLVK